MGDLHSFLTAFTHWKHAVFTALFRQNHHATPATVDCEGPQGQDHILAMANDRLLQEAKAYGGFAKLVEDAQANAALFESAGLEMPDRLRRFLGDDMETSSTPRLTISPPEAPERPREAPPDAIWVAVPDMLPTGLTLAILRRANAKGQGPISMRAIVDELVRFGKQVNVGSIQNLGKRLDSQRKIARTDEGWILKDESSAPVLHGEYVWGHPSVFTNQEVASYRRMLELHVLRAYPSGLQSVQWFEVLAGCSWVPPLSKDVLKLDIDALAESQRIRRVGATKKWEVAM